MYLLLWGATPTPATHAGWAAIVLGAALILSYCALVGDGLNRLLKTESSAAPFMPVLLVLGVFTLVQALTGALTSVHKGILLVAGLALIVVPAAVLAMLIKGRRG